MIEFYTSKRIDNSRLARPSASRWREYARRLAWAGALASCALLYTWQHFQDIQLRYQLQEVQARQAQAMDLNQQLHLEAASLTSPMRIDAIARQQLGMTASATLGPEFRRRVQRLEQICGRSFFPPNYIPKRYQTGFDEKSGKSYPRSEDVFTYLEMKTMAELPFEDHVSCSSIYNLCER